VFLKCNSRTKDGKTHHYWNVVESRRLSDRRVVQRQVLYLGEINDSQREAWRKTIEVLDEGSRRQVALFPIGSMPGDDAQVVGIRLNELELVHPRQWGACWLSTILWQQLQLDQFWDTRVRASRKGTQWLQVLKTLVAYRLIDPGSEWRLHRHWYEASAMSDLLNANFALAEKDTLYRCLDKLVEHKDDLFKFLHARWGELFEASFDVLLYDLTSTYFETDTPRKEEDKRQYGYSRDKRFDCRQVVIACSDRDSGRLSVELRSARGQHQGLEHADRFPQTHRDALRSCEADLDHGPWHPHRTEPGTDARDGRLVPGGYPKGAAEQTGESLSL
jgi:hypothetical protein